ncbi:hypothetical protein DPX16_9634 [Anabarilius grahami]|uniref:Uncharacterized protein n=1 Tax=Anabarilius grahami TaxID=495550 RepID=A0A3N0Y457_ANAGA|nr:hypothetical protein DPX16_9634 [Anabarilius grahami]
MKSYFVAKKEILGHRLPFLSHSKDTSTSVETTGGCRGRKRCADTSGVNVFLIASCPQRQRRVISADRRAARPRLDPGFLPVMPAYITLYASTSEISFSVPFFSRSHPHGSGVLQGRRK